MCPHRIGEQVDFHTADDPNDLWPQTTWQQDTSGTFPMASSSAHALGSTGGSETHMLTVDEMPSHTHKFTTNSAVLWCGADRDTGDGWSGAGYNHPNPPDGMWKIGDSAKATGGVFSQYPQSLHGRQPLEAGRVAGIGSGVF